MMAGNFQQMGNGGMQQGMQQGQLPPNIQIVLHQSIRSSTPAGLTGWQSMIPEQDRLAQVLHIVTQLRLASSKPNESLQQYCQLALTFEKAAFDGSGDRDTYLNVLRDKLNQLTAHRQQQVNALQAQQRLGMNGGMGGQIARPNMAQHQPQQGFGQLQQQMQASPIPGQQTPQQMPLGFSNNMMGQGMAQNQQFAMNQPQPQPQQAPIPNPQGAQRAGQMLDPQRLNDMAKQMEASATDEQKAQIRATMSERMDQATLLRYQNQGLDLASLYFRQQAANRMRVSQQRQQQAAMMQQQRSMQGQNMVDGNQLAMQANLSQQGNTTPQSMAGMPPQAVTPQNLRQQQQFNSSQVAANQAQQQAQAQARKQMAALHGQPGGMGTMPPTQQSPAMNTLNAPLTQNAAPPSQFGQPIDPRFNPRNGMNGGQVNATFPPNISAEQRTKLANLPPDKFQEIIAKLNQRPGPGPQTGVPVQMSTGQSSAQNNPMSQGAMGQMFLPNGQPIPRPTPQMMAGMTPQQQMMLRQQQMAQQQGRGDMIPQLSQLDGMDFPSQAYTIVPQQLLPADLKKWGPLKQWVMANGHNNGLNVPNVLEQIKSLQRYHLGSMLRTRMSQQAKMGGMVQPGLQAPGQPMDNQVSGMQGQMLFPQQPMQIAMEDIQKARAHPSGRWAHRSDDEIRQMIQQQKLAQQRQIALMQAQQSQQLLQNQMNANAQMGQLPQMGGQNMPPNQMQRPMGAPPPTQPGFSVGGKTGRPPPGQKAPPTPKQQAQTQPDTKQLAQARASKSGQPGSSPAQANKNNLKRASSDDVVEVPNPNSHVARPNMQQLNPQQRQSQQQLQRPPVLSPQQIEALPAERKQAYFQMVQKWKFAQAAQQGLTPELQQRLQAIRLDEMSKFKPFPELSFGPAERQAMLGKLKASGAQIMNVFKVAPRWFAMFKDETRFRALLRAQHRITQQFEDGAAMQKPRAAFTMGPKDVDEAIALAKSIINDVVNKFPAMNKGGAPGQPQPPNSAANASQQQPPVQNSMPLNAANLQQQQQALATQKAHNRTASNSQTPAAPTTTQAPPFSVNSPQGVPAMYGPAKIDQGQLRLPPNKKRKGSNGSTPILPQKPAPSNNNDQNMESNTEGQQGQGAEIKQGPPPLLCKDPQCDAHYGQPFASKGELDRHNHEEHEKYIENAQDFFLGELAECMGLNPDGTEREAGSGTQPSGTPSTGMSKNITAKNKDAVAKKEDTAADAYTTKSVYQREIQGVFKQFAAPADGAIINSSLFRSPSCTPTDTPESSKDGLSANSDVTDGMDVAIGIQYNEQDTNWMPYGAGDMGSFLHLGDTPVASGEKDLIADASAGENWEDQFIDYNEPEKPFTFEAGIFRMSEGGV